MIKSNRENEILKLSSKRYDFIDIAKGFGILFVIIAHINYTPSLLTVIYSFHMPLFFFLSGMVFNSSKYGGFSEFFRRKAKTLLCPYVLFYIFSILYRFFVVVVADPENLNWEGYLSYFLQMFLSQGSAKLPNAPLWFVPCLFLVENIYYWISKMKKPLIVVIAVLLTTLGWVLESDILPLENELLPWSLDSALFAIGFFALGNLSFENICRVIEKLKECTIKKQVCVIMFFVSFVVLIPIALYNGKVSLGSKVLGNGLLFYITGTLGTIGILGLSMLFEKNRFLQYCGRNSFQIMAVHCLIRDFLRLIYKFFDIEIYDNTNLVETIFPIIIIGCLSLLFSLFYNKIKTLFEKRMMGKSL